MFREISVWKHVDGASAARYRCFQCVKTGVYAVQSVDFYRLPIDEKQLAHFNRQFVELFVESSPLARCEWFETIEEAISRHEANFS